MSKVTTTLPHFAWTLATFLSFWFNFLWIPFLIDSSNFALSAPFIKAVQLIEKENWHEMRGFPTVDPVVVGGAANEEKFIRSLCQSMKIKGYGRQDFFNMFVRACSMKMIIIEHVPEHSTIGRAQA